MNIDRSKVGVDPLKITEPITLDMIATRAGVTKATVSNVLNRNRVGTRSDAVRNARRIRKIAEELGYRPNMAARAIQSRKYHAIGLLAGTSPRASVYYPFIEGMTEGCRLKDLHLSVGEVADEKLTDEQFVPKILREWSVDGLLIAYMYNFPPHLSELVDKFRIPYAWLNVKREHDCVHLDDFGGAYQATEYLLALGHRRIMYAFNGATIHYSTVDRRDGYAAAMNQAGLEPAFMYSGLSAEVPMPQFGADARKLLQRPDRPTAMIAYGRSQMSAVAYASATLGLSIPQDLSILAFDREPIHEIGREMGTILLGTHEAGLRAVGLLAAKIARPSKFLDPIAVPCKQVDFQASTAEFRDDADTK